MQIEIIKNNGLGERVLLPPELALDDFELGVDIPGVEVPGRHGRRQYRHLRRVEPRTIRASGTIKGIDKNEADELADIYRGVLLGSSDMWLKRYEGADKHIKVSCTRINHNYHRGRFSGSLFTMSIVFDADDPFWYTSAYVEVTESVTFTPPVTMLAVINKGTVYTNPMIWITGTSAGVNTKNPKLTNYTTGIRVQYIGELAAGHQLILNTEDRLAIRMDDNQETAGTSQGGGANYIVLASDGTSTDDAYKDLVIRITSGVGSGQYRRIIGYNGATKAAFVGVDWDVVPDATSQYVIYKRESLESFYLYEAMIGSFISGDNVINNMNTGYLLDGFPLAPGTNLIELEDDNSADTGKMEISILFRERWY